MPCKGYFPSFLIFSYCHDICNNIKTTRKERAATGDGWDSSKDPSCVLARWASLPRPLRDCSGQRDFPASPVLGQPVSDVTVYFSTVVICNKLGTRGA